MSITTAVSFLTLLEKFINNLMKIIIIVGLMHQAQNIKKEFKNFQKFPVSNTSNFHKQLLDFYYSGNREQFYVLWRQNISTEARNQNFTYLKIEFYVSLYFCLYPLFAAIGLVKPDQEYTKEQLSKWYKEEIKNFKKYLDLYGSDFSRTTEFLSYYALSYVENPITHSSFAQLFTEDWINEREKLLKKFIQKEFPERQTSRIEKILKFYQKYSKIDLSELWSKNESAIEPVMKSDHPSGLYNDETLFSRENNHNLAVKEISGAKSMDITSPNQENEDLQNLKDDYSHIKGISISLLECMKKIVLNLANEDSAKRK